MEQKGNYQKQLDQIIKQIAAEDKQPKLLLHSCCAPCSSYVLEYLSPHFQITVFYYNPNIHPESEYTKRVVEQQKLIRDMRLSERVSFMAGHYDKEKFYQIAAGLEQEKEGRARCLKCYQLRLEETARIAAEGGYDYFATTLTVSPLKSSAKLNEIGLMLQEKYQVAWLPSDFKKKGGYRRSVELSNQYGLYRQDYCGCEFSLENRKK